MFWFWFLLFIGVNVLILYFAFIWLLNDFRHGGDASEALAERLQQLNLLPSHLTVSRDQRANALTSRAALIEDQAISGYETRIAELEDLNQDLEVTNRALQEKVAVLETKLDQLRHELNKTAQDDLQAIKGIGPVFANLLHEFEITSYRQIALMSEDELTELAAKLDISLSRIQRDDWTSRAKEEHWKKYGERL